MILIVIAKLSVMELLIHIDVRLYPIDEIEQYEVGEVDDE